MNQTHFGSPSAFVATTFANHWSYTLRTLSKWKTKKTRKRIQSLNENQFFAKQRAEEKARNLHLLPSIWRFAFLSKSPIGMSGLRSGVEWKENRSIWRLLDEMKWNQEKCAFVQLNSEGQLIVCSIHNWSASNHRTPTASILPTCFPIAVPRRMCPLFRLAHSIDSAKNFRLDACFVHNAMQVDTRIRRMFACENQNMIITKIRNNKKRRKCKGADSSEYFIRILNTSSFVFQFHLCCMEKRRIKKKKEQKRNKTIFTSNRIAGTFSFIFISRCEFFAALRSCEQSAERNDLRLSVASVADSMKPFM